MEKAIYESIIINNEGVKGTSYSYGGNNFSVKLSPVAESHLGTNPEQLIAFSWASCFNSTVQSIVKNPDVKSKVVVWVSLHKDKPIGLFFKLHAKIAVEGKTLEETTAIANKAHHFCPVSKLIRDNEHVTIEAVSFSELKDF